MPFHAPSDPPGIGDRLQNTAGAAARGVSDAMDHVANATGQTIDAVTAFRTSVRNTPLMMSAVILGIGYVLGTILHSRPRGLR